MKPSLGNPGSRLSEMSLPSVPFPGVLAFLTLALSLLFPASPGRTVITYDLLHDTPVTREVLKEELGVVLETADMTRGDQPAKSESIGELEDIWFSREKFLQIGEREKARLQIELLWQREMELGIRNLPTYGEVLVREARRAMRRGRLTEAGDLLTTARKLSPEFLPVYFARAGLVIRERPWDFLGAGRKLFEGFEALERSFRLQSWAVTNLFFTARSAAIVFFSLFVGIVFIRNAGRIAHDISEAMPLRLSVRTRTLLGWLVLLLPALIGLPAAWWFIIAGLLLLPYVGRFPRIILFAALFFLLSLPWQARIAGSLMSMHRQPLLERVVSVREDHWDVRDYFALRKMAVEEEGSPFTLASYGLAAKRLGFFDEADEAYRAALEAVPDDPALWNNLGNLALIGKRADEAIEHYSRAVAIDPDLFAPHYNLSLAYREKFLFPEGERESRRAGEIDHVAEAYYTGIAGEHFNRYTVDELPPVEKLWQLALSQNKWQQATADHLWRASMLLVPRQAWPFVLGGLTLVALGMWAWRSSRGAAGDCPKCGRAFCPRCAPARGGRLCSQCHHIFVRKEGVEAKTRVRKMAEIKRTQKLLSLRRIILAVLVPGGGHLSAGRYVPGVLFLLPAALFLARLLPSQEPFPAAWYLRLTGGWGLTAMGVVLYALWWAMSFWSSLRIEE